MMEALSVSVQHGGVAVPFGMAPPGVATTADDARFCMSWAAAAHFENWGDSGIVVTSPLAETASTDVDDVSGGNHHDAQMVCSARLYSASILIPAVCLP